MSFSIDVLCLFPQQIQGSDLICVYERFVVETHHCSAAGINFGHEQKPQATFTPRDE